MVSLVEGTLQFVGKLSWTNMLALKGQWSNTDLISVTDKQGMFPNCALTALGEILNRGDVSLIINIMGVTYLKSCLSQTPSCFNFNNNMER